MKIKKGAVIAGLRPEMRKVLLAADRLWRIYGKELVITSGLDGTHSPGSYHYYGHACDLRNRYFKTEDRQVVADLLQKELGSHYFVLNEATHIHVHYRGDY